MISIRERAVPASKLQTNQLFLLLVSLLAYACCVVQKSSAANVLINFDLTSQSYNGLSSTLRGVLSRPSSPPYNPSDVRGRYVLGPRRPEFAGAPLSWIFINVHFGPAATENTTLAIAADDLYLLGFKNRTNCWHVLKGGFAGLPDSVTLPIRENYQDLVGGHKKLYKVPLGNQSAIWAARILANYDLSSTPQQELADAMVRFVVMISEAMRFRVIRDTFSGRWEQETFITEQQAKYVVIWGKVSRLLVKWQRSPYRPWDTSSADAQAAADVGINNANDAWGIVDFLLRPFN